jgi:hypothetical protein
MLKEWMTQWTMEDFEQLRKQKKKIRRTMKSDAVDADVIKSESDVTEPSPPQKQYRKAQQQLNVDINFVSSHEQRRDESDEYDCHGTFDSQEWDDEEQEVVDLGTMADRRRHRKTIISWTRGMNRCMRKSYLSRDLRLSGDSMSLT